jgi:hypothetical protein
MMLTSEKESLEQELTTLKEEVAVLKREFKVMKMALKNEITRFEIDQVKKGKKTEPISLPMI